eukprot:10359596-Lingulodinium_polyedra.AAC.1
MLCGDWDNPGSGWQQVWIFGISLSDGLATVSATVGRRCGKRWIGNGFGNGRATMWQQFGNSL